MDISISMERTMKRAKASTEGTSSKPGKKNAPGGRDDGRRATSIYLTLEILTGLQNAATYERRHAYEIVEDALKEYLAKKKFT
jgi:hypothetical protein